MSLLDCISRNLKEYAQDAAYVSLISLTADLKYRIHNEGGKTVGKIGRYKSPYWIKQRQQQGRQVGYIDLQYTGQLFRDLSTGQSQGDAVMGFLSNRSMDLHDHLEKRYGPIWRPSKIESQDLVSRFKDELNERLRNCR